MNLSEWWRPRRWPALKSVILTQPCNPTLFAWNWRNWLYCDEPENDTLCGYTRQHWGKIFLIKIVQGTTNPQTMFNWNFFWRWSVVLTRMIAEISFLTGFSIAFDSTKLIKSLIKKFQTSNEIEGSFFLTRRLWTLLSYFVWRFLTRVFTQKLLTASFPFYNIIKTSAYDNICLNKN